MKTIIISNGEINNYKFFSNIVESADRIICADGGIRHAMNMKLTPDVIIGSDHLQPTRILQRKGR